MYVIHSITNTNQCDVSTFLQGCLPQTSSSLAKHLTPCQWCHAHSCYPVLPFRDTIAPNCQFPSISRCTKQNFTVTYDICTPVILGQVRQLPPTCHINSHVQLEGTLLRAFILYHFTTQEVEPPRNINSCYANWLVVGCIY